MKFPLDSSVIEPIPLDTNNNMITQDLQRLEIEGLSCMLKVLDKSLERDDYTSFFSPNTIKLHGLQSLSEGDDMVVGSWGKNKGFIRNVDSIHFDDPFGSPSKKLKTYHSIDSGNNIMSQDLPKLERQGLSNSSVVMENSLETDTCPPLPRPFPSPSGPLVGGLHRFSNTPSIMDNMFESNDCLLPSPRPCVPVVDGLLYENEEVDITGNDRHDNNDVVGEIQPISPTRMIDGTSSSPSKEVKASLSALYDVDAQVQRTQNSFSNYRSVEDSTKDLHQYDESFHSETWNQHSEKWHQNFQELLKFHRVNGHCLVPHKWMENVGLAHWVKRQRYQYKLKTGGMRTTLTDSRMDALDKLGFVWEPQAAKWEESFNDLRDYKKRHGTCNVPGKCVAFRRLGLWVQSQRRQYRNFMRGKQSTLTVERIEKLISLEFVWNPCSLKLKN